VTRGLALLAVAAAGGALAESLPAPALLAPAVALALVTLTAGAAVALGARRLTVARTIAAHEVTEAEGVTLRFAACGLGPPLTLEARDPTGAWRPLGGELRIALTRGEHRLGPSELRVRDPLGIFERRRRAGGTELVLVLPTPDLDAPPPASIAGLGGDAEPDGLAPYAPGTPAARIHWPSLARGAGLHERRVTAPPAGLPLVVVDAAAEAGAMDRAARVAAGQILRLSRTGGCRVLLPGDNRAVTVVDAASWRALHRRLARLQPCRS
jgi:uncharacterized protein (DUF58 family)